MGISTSVLFVTDEQIQEFTKHPIDAENLFIGCINFGTEKCCHLHQYWNRLHYLLTGEVEGGDLPLCALKRGDVTYAGVLDPTHAIYSTTTKALSQELNTLSEQKLSERFDPSRTITSGGHPVYPGRLWLNPKQTETTSRELISYFGRLRDFAVRAARQDKGLLFCRYEDF